MHTPITITAVHINTYKIVDMPMGVVEVSLEINGKWIKILSEKFDPDRFHVSHIVEGNGIAHMRSLEPAQ